MDFFDVDLDLVLSLILATYMGAEPAHHDTQPPLPPMPIVRLVPQESVVDRVFTSRCPPLKHGTWQQATTEWDVCFNFGSSE